ncbi:pore complex protein Nup62 [Mesorhizobium sp. NFR06]|uniref:hypothetical protein n=1 Tax=Mesorhizobium sp. NFR06 TaxID=1566290 RepID=UPI0008EA68D0|nr:hypothetical protein [Mesorhizobium sp. NFR06]SFP01172.1 pore complex protein Nup62 [Mesorhizobium sp. NFR06]
MMRLLGAFGIGLLAMSGAAHASSIVVLGVSTSTPSVIRLKAIEPAKLSAAATPSVIALGDPAPAVTDEKVAAIPEKSGHQQAPMIIRGGIVGGAFATPAATASAKPETSTTTPATTPAAATKANGTAAASPANGTTAASNGNGKTGSQRAATANASAGAQPQAQNAPSLPRVGKAM